MNPIKQYFWNILIWLDQGGNTLTFGSPDETLSSRLGRNYRGTWIEKAVDWAAYLITGKKDHCENALEPPECQEGAILAMKEEKKDGNIHQDVV